jgi:putative membrane protein
VLLASTPAYQDLLAWHPHLEVWGILLVALAADAAAISRWGKDAVSPEELPVTRRQLGCFLGGMGVLWIGATWPIHDVAENYLLSVHMFQHLVFSLIAAPLLLTGIPAWLWRKLLAPKILMAVFKRIARPLPALLLFNFYLVVSHTPAFMDAVLVHHQLHFWAHSLLLLVSIVMWWPVFSPLPELPRASTPVQLLYLFGQTIIPTVPASFLTFGDKALYRFYEDAPRLFSGVSPLTDQRIGGLTMKLFGGFLLWGVIAVLFFRWSSKEQKGTPDEVEWQDLERKLNQPRSVDL